MQNVLPEGEVPTISIGQELYTTRTQQRVEYGDPSLQGTASSLNPGLYEAGIAGAYYAHEATRIVQEHVGRVYDGWPRS